MKTLVYSVGLLLQCFCVAFGARQEVGLSDRSLPPLVPVPPSFREERQLERNDLELPGAADSSDDRSAEAAAMRDAVLQALLSRRLDDYINNNNNGDYENSQENEFDREAAAARQRALNVIKLGVEGEEQQEQQRREAAADVERRSMGMLRMGRRVGGGAKRTMDMLRMGRAASAVDDGSSAVEDSVAAAGAGASSSKRAMGMLRMGRAMGMLRMGRRAAPTKKSMGMLRMGR